jgi:hypothetical protein
MASFNNADPSETLDALRAGLAGETEPLRRFGVSLSDARLKQEAMNMGIYKGKGPLTPTRKAQATYALILKDTKDAAGRRRAHERRLGTRQPAARAQGSSAVDNGDDRQGARHSAVPITSSSRACSGS